MIDTNNTNAKEKFNDYEASPVPPDVHISWISQGSVWIGFGFCLAAISTGGILASGLGFYDMLLAATVGALILTAIAVFVGLVGAHVHLSSSMSSRFCFGVNGAKAFGVILAISNFGWFAFQADLFGNTVVVMLQKSAGVLYDQTIFTVLGAAAMVATAMVGYRAIKWLANIAVPLLFGLSLVAVYMTLQEAPLSAILSSGPVGAPIPLTVGIAAVVGNFAVGVTLVSDFTRYSARPKDSILGCILGFFIGYLPILLLGAFFTYAFQNWNIVDVMVSTLGLGYIAAIILILAQWTTNDNNLYSSVLGLSNALEGYVPYVRWKLTLLVGSVSTLVSAIGVQKYYMDFLIILTSTIPAAAGVIIADFFLLNRKSYDYKKINSLPNYRWNAIIAWAAAALTGLCMSNPPTGLGVGFMVALANYIPIPVVGIIVAFALNIALSPFFYRQQR